MYEIDVGKRVCRGRFTVPIADLSALGSTNRPAGRMKPGPFGLCRGHDPVAMGPIMKFNKPGVQVFLGRVVRPGTHKGPPHPPNRPVPLHVGNTTPPPSDGAVDTRAGWWARRHVVARGWVGGGWALVGARRRANRNLSGREGYVVGCPMADKSAVGAINRPLQSLAYIYFITPAWREELA